jgi:HAD superfamily hydrolase (TIGR01459 family)
MQQIDGLHQIASAFDALIVDQFGVLHDGFRAYPRAAECVAQLRDAGKQIVVLSNSGRRASANRQRLAALGFDPAAFDAVITSGEVAWRALSERSDEFHRALGRRCYIFAEADPKDFLSGLDLAPAASVAEADFLLVIGIDTPRRSLDDYAADLAEGARRHLPMLCANSDLVRLTRSGLQPAPGALARRYEQMGGTVRGYGKPLPTIFGHCLEALNGVDRRRVLAVGDSLEHDILGAQAAGLASVYVRGGIGREETPEAFAAATERLGVQPSYCTNEFRW